MPVSVSQYIRQQTRDFMTAFNRVASHPVGVRNPGQTNSVDQASTWQWDAKLSVQKAFIRTPSRSQREYWAHVDYGGYREAFLSFLDAHFGLQRSLLGPSWHVDHLLNRAFARKHGLFYVRISLLPAASNTGYGRLMEKRFTNIEARSKSMYLLDYAVMMKLLNIQPPLSKAHYVARRIDIAKTFVVKGFDGSMELALQGLDGEFSLWNVL